MKTKKDRKAGGSVSQEQRRRKPYLSRNNRSGSQVVSDTSPETQSEILMRQLELNTALERGFRDLEKKIKGAGFGYGWHR